MLKRWLIGLLFILTFVTLMPSLYVQAGYDATPPVVEKVEVLTPVVAQGSKVKVKITASDDLSGVHYMTLSFSSPSERNQLTCTVFADTYEVLSSEFIAECNELTAWSEYGEWFLQTVVISDFARNIIAYSRSNTENIFMQDISFTVDPNAPEKDVEVNDGFEAIETKQDAPLNKEFTISFNMDIDISTILERNIYVQDGKGSRVPLLFIIDRGRDLTTSKVTVAPVGEYRAGSSYTLYIKDVKSTNGLTLSQNTKMKFTTRE